MTEDRLLIEELAAKGGQPDFLRTIAKSVLQLIMEADVDGLIGAGWHERSGERATWRNGYRDRSLDTRVGTLNLKIPKLRTGSYFPGFLEPRKMVEKALVAVDKQANYPEAAASFATATTGASGAASRIRGIISVKISAFRFNKSSRVSPGF